MGQVLISLTTRLRLSRVQAMRLQIKLAATSISASRSSPANPHIAEIRASNSHDLPAERAFGVLDRDIGAKSGIILLLKSAISRANFSETSNTRPSH